jgi:tungstate transport system substrate-binding protein
VIRLVAILSIVAIASGCGASPERVVVATGTTIVDSGYIEALIDEYPGDGEFSIVAASSREGFALGEGGAADVLFTHLAEAEDAYVAEHPESLQAPAFTSRFLLVGPADQGTVAPGADVADAFSLIASANAPFVSRGDGSGTAARESAIWDIVGIDPAREPWHIETGQGMGFTLQVTDQRDAFTLVEGGSFFADASVLSLVEVPVTASPDSLLSNPYRITVIDPAAGAGATGLFEWLASAEGREAMIRVNETLYGGIVYTPAS